MLAHDVKPLSSLRGVQLLCLAWAPLNCNGELKPGQPFVGGELIKEQRPKGDCVLWACARSDTACPADVSELFQSRECPFPGHGGLCPGGGQLQLLPLAVWGLQAEPGMPRTIMWAGRSDSS